MPPTRQDQRVLDTLVALSHGGGACDGTVFQTLALRAMDLLTVDGVAILTVDADGEMTLASASSATVANLEWLELQAQDGPAWECFRSGQAVRGAKLARTGRWPVFQYALAPSATYRCVDALPLRAADQLVGAVELFSDHPRGLSASDLSLARAMADVAATTALRERALRHSEHRQEQLESALGSRVVIEQAKGVLAGRGDMPVDQAFELLRQYARRNSQRLIDVAAAVVRFGLADDVLAARARPARSRGRRPARDARRPTSRQLEHTTVASVRER